MQASRPTGVPHVISTEASASERSGEISAVTTNGTLRSRFLDCAAYGRSARNDNGTTQLASRSESIRVHVAHRAGFTRSFHGKHSAFLLDAAGRVRPRNGQAVTRTSFVSSMLPVNIHWMYNRGMKGDSYGVRIRSSQEREERGEAPQWMTWGLTNTLITAGT